MDDAYPSDDLDTLVWEHLQARRATSSRWPSAGVSQSTGKPSAGGSSSAEGQDEGLEIVVHRDVRPSCLTTAGPGTFSRQLDIIWPMVSATAPLVAAAEKGSAALAQFRQERDREQQAASRVDLTKSDFTQMIDPAAAARNAGKRQPNRHGARGSAAGRDDGVDDAAAYQRELESVQRKIRRLEGEASAPSAFHTQRLSNSAAPSGDTTRAHSVATAPSTLAHAAPFSRPSHEASERARLTNESNNNNSERSDRRRFGAEPASTVLSASAVGTPSPEARARLRAVRMSLPIYPCRAEILRCIAENSVVILMGETGSGKTTQLVQYLYEAGYATGNRLIGCTQPRRLAAIGVATRVAEEVGCPLGSTVGYSIHLDDCTSESTKVRFMTDGVLLREVVHDPLLDKYSCIVMDEAHERSIDTDVLLGVLKGVCRRRVDLRVIVTSATMNIMKFSAFFDHAPIFEVPGRTYEVDVRYASSPVEDYVQEAVLKVISIHINATCGNDGTHRSASEAAAATATASAPGSSSDSLAVDDGIGTAGDILVFMTGRDDVFGTCEMIRERLRLLPPRKDGSSWEDTMLIIPCMSEAVQRESAQVLFHPSPPGKRKCVVATNVAETSLTIDGIRYVVDCGMMKTNVFHPKFGMNTLKRYPTSQAQANQRKGRAGRTAAGVCFRLYTNEQFLSEMLPSPVPEIQRSSVDSVVLLLKSIGVNELDSFDFLDPPPEVNLRTSLWQLWLFGALTDQGTITTSGRCMLEFPLTPMLAAILLHGVRLDCAVEMVSILAMLSSDCKNLFDCPEGHEEDARQLHGRFNNGESDHLTLLNVFQQYAESNYSRSWAKEHFLHVPTLERAVRAHEQLVEKVTRAKLPLRSAGRGNTDVIRRALVHGYCLQAARRAPGKWTEFHSLLNPGVACNVTPTSSILSAGSVPEYIVYDDLVVTTKEYMVTVTAVDPRWLVEVGRGLYTIKGENSIRHDGDEMRAVMENLGGRAGDSRHGGNAADGAMPPATLAAQRRLPSTTGASLLDALLSGSVNHPRERAQPAANGSRAPPLGSETQASGTGGAVSWRQRYAQQQQQLPLPMSRSTSTVVDSDPERASREQALPLAVASNPLAPPAAAPTKQPPLDPVRAMLQVKRRPTL